MAHLCRDHTQEIANLNDQIKALQQTERSMKSRVASLDKERMQLQNVRNTKHV